MQDIIQLGNFNPKNKPLTKPQITLENTTKIVCPCGCKIFAEGIKMRKVSGLLIGEAQDKVLPLPAVYCVKCFKEFTNNDL